MKEILVNLKRFDIPKSLGGVSDEEIPGKYAEAILQPLVEPLREYKETAFTFFFPEAHLIQAGQILHGSSNMRIGCQSNYVEDVASAGNFGAFTSFRTASSMRAIGCQVSLIGHCEERKYFHHLYGLAGVNDQKLVNRLLNRQIRQAQAQGMEVCYCIGEAETQLECWDQVLLEQLSLGLAEVDRSRIIIGYEPLWSIGPGKTPADAEYIEKVVDLIKGFDENLRVIYGGGVKQDNAPMLAQLKTLDGGLIGLTNFKENIGFHPDEFLEIVRIYAQAQKG